VKAFDFKEQSGKARIVVLPYGVDGLFGFLEPFVQQSKAFGPRRHGDTEIRRRSKAIIVFLLLTLLPLCILFMYGMVIERAG